MLMVTISSLLLYLPWPVAHIVGETIAYPDLKEVSLYFCFFIFTFSDLNKMKVLVLCALFGAALSEVFFEEQFNDGDAWESRLVLPLSVSVSVSFSFFLSLSLSLSLSFPLQSFNSDE